MAGLRTTEIIWNASLISGMMLFLKTYGQDSDDASFSQRMEAIDPQEIVRRSKTDCGTTRKALRVARVLLEKYNKARGGRKLAYRFNG